MPASVMNGGAETQRILARANEVIRHYRGFRTKGRETCIKGRANSARITVHNCDDPTLGGWNEQKLFLGIKISASPNIHICINNIGANDRRLRDVLIHEWAHSCCWDHGDGGGIPGNDGFIR